MFCSNCGKEIDDKAVVCVYCGCATNNNTSASSDKNWMVALLLCFFLGCLGAHRFYVGKIGTAITILLINLLIGWLLVPLIFTSIWVLIDFIMICTNSFKTIDGKTLVK